MSIRLIGQVAVGDDPDHHISAPKLACVLAVLANAPGTPVHHFDLITSTWGADPPKSVIAVLYSYIARLRSILQRVPSVSLRSDRQHYVLDIDPGLVDVHLVRQLASHASERRSLGHNTEALALLREASQLAGSEALVGVGGDWAANFRAGFRSERLNILAERYAVELELGHHHAVLPDLTRLVAREPTAERLVEHLMLAHYRDGSPAEALDVFGAARDRFRDRLGVDPSPQLRRLHVQILNQDPSLDMAAAETVIAPSNTKPAAPAQLPADTRGFTGRDDDVAAVTARAAEGNVVVIDGMAGVGKTALAVHVGHRLAEEYPDGQLFLDLRGYADGVPPTQPHAALTQLLRSLDLDVPDDPDERSAAWRAALAGRRILLVLDNAADAEQVRPLLPGDSRCLTLVTSRRRLVHLVDALPVSLGVMPLTEAAKVFAGDAGIDSQSVVAERIAETCGCLPLALRIAASRLRNRPTWTPEVLLKRLMEGHGPIRELDGSGQGIEAAFGLSYHELEEPTKQLFRVLSVFSGAAIDRHRAAALAGIDTERAETLLEQLVDAHLIAPVTHDRYQMHDLMRQYAAAALPAEDRREAWRRLAEFYISAVWQAVALTIPLPVNWPRQLTVPAAGIQPPGDAAEAETWMREELPVLERLIIEADEHGFDAHLIDLCLPTQSYLMHHGAARARLLLARLGAAAARRLGAGAAEARMENFLGVSHKVLGDYDVADRHLERALELWRGLDDAVGHVTALNNLAVVTDRRGDGPRTEALTSAAVEVARRADSPAHLAHLLFNQAGTLLNLRRFDEAAASLDECEIILADLGNARLSAWAWSRRGMLLCDTGRHALAVPWFQKTLDYGERDGVTDIAQVGLWGLAEAYLGMDEPDRAMPYIDRQLELLERLNLSSNRAETLGQLGNAHIRLGQLPEAIETLRGAIEVAEGIGAHRHLARAHRLLGEALLASGDATARDHLRCAMELYETGGFPDAEDIREQLDDDGRGPDGGIIL